MRIYIYLKKPEVSTKHFFYLYSICSLLTGCSLSNTDHLEPRQIVSAPKKQWIRWDEDAPIDVSQEKVKTKSVCPRTRED